MSSSLSTGPRCPGLRPCPFPCWPPSWHLRLRRPLIGQCWPGPGPWLANTKWHLTGEHWPLSEERRGTKGYFYYTHEHEKSHYYLVYRYKWVLSKLYMFFLHINTTFEWKYFLKARTKFETKTRWITILRWDFPISESHRVPGAPRKGKRIEASRQKNFSECTKYLNHPFGEI